MTAKAPDHSAPIGMWRKRLSLVAAALLLGTVAVLTIGRYRPGANSAAPHPLPATSAADLSAVEALVSLSPKETIVRTRGYQTLRVETTNQVVGYSTAIYFTKARTGQSWIRQKLEMVTRQQSDLITVEGSIPAGELVSIVAAVDLAKFGQIQRIVAVDQDAAKVFTGHRRPLAGRYFTLRLERTQGVWRVAEVLGEAVS